MKLREPDVGSLIAWDRHSRHGLRERSGEAAEVCRRGVLGEAEAPRGEGGNGGNVELNPKRFPGSCPMVRIWEESEIEQKLLEPKWLRSVLLMRTAVNNEHLLSTPE